MDFSYILLLRFYIKNKGLPKPAVYKKISMVIFVLSRSDPVWNWVVVINRAILRLKLLAINLIRFSKKA